MQANHFPDQDFEERRSRSSGVSLSQIKRNNGLILTVVILMSLSRAQVSCFSFRNERLIDRSWSLSDLDCITSTDLKLRFSSTSKLSSPPGTSFPIHYIMKDTTPVEACTDAVAFQSSAYSASSSQAPAIRQQTAPISFRSGDKRPPKLSRAHEP